MRTRPRGAVRTSALSVLAFTLAAVVGRQTILPGTELSLVWPAAGIAGVWLAAHVGSRWLAVDAALLGAASLAVNSATGAGLALAVGIAVGAVVQALALAALLARWAPELVGFADDPPEGIVRVRALAALVAAAVGASAASALVGPATILALREQDWAVVASWVVRNTTGVLAVFPLALGFPHLVRKGLRWHTSRARAAETAGLVAVTAVALWLIFDVNRQLPLAFLLLVLCVGVGARYAPGPAVLYAAGLSAVVVVLAVTHGGPFAEIEDGYQRALVVQAFVLVVVLVPLALAVARRENALLNEALVASEQAARDQALLMLTIVDSMGDGVVVVDDDGHPVLRNPAAARIVGADGRPDLPDGVSEQVLRAEGSERRMEVTATQIEDSSLRVVVYHDVTAERREREQLASFAGVVAHDLLNPLTTIEGWSRLMAEDLTDPAVQRYVTRVQGASSRMHALIDDLLAWTTARDLAIDPEPVDTTALARDVAQARVEAAQATGLQPSVVVRDLPAVLGAPLLLRQALDNLVGNAIKYVAPGVRPTVEVSGRLVGSGFAELTIADNGIGIPAGQHASVFETFHRAHGDDYRGTGLGLSIVQRVADRHGGSVAAADRPGGGTTITLVLPAA